MIPVIIGDKDIIIEQVTAEDGEFQHYAIKFSPELTERLNRLNDLETHTSFADWKKKVVYHPPKSDVQRFAHKQVNYICEEAGNKLMRNCPKSDELDMALLKIQEARMWANAALAIHINSPQDDSK